MATFVLLHEAFQGGWVWGRVASILRRERHEVYAPTLTGCGDRSHLLKEGIDLHTHIQDLTNFLHFENLSNMILVSHGYSGMAASAVIQTMPHVLGKIVYLDGILPEKGKSYLDLAGEGFGHVLNSHLHNNWLVKPWSSLSFGISSPIDKEWFGSRLVNFPLAAFTTPFPGRFDSSLFDISFIHSTKGAHDLSESRAHDAGAGRRPCRQLESGPLPMVAAPGKLAEMLMAMGD